jgi:hypothetical protein
MKKIKISNFNLNRIFIAFVVFAMLMSTVTIQQVIGASVTYEIDFESGVVGNQYSDAIASTHKLTGNASVSSYGAKTGTKSYENTDKIEYFSTGKLQTLYQSDDGNQYVDVVCNYTHAFVSSMSGFMIYYIANGTLVESYSGSFYSIDQDLSGNYFLTCSNTSGIYIFNFDGTNITKVATIHNGTAGNNYWGIWYDQWNGYVHVATDEGVFAYQWSDPDISYLDDDNQDVGGNYRDVTGDGTYVYVCDPHFGFGLLAHSFAGTYTYITSATDGWADQFWDVWTDGVYIYTANLYNGTLVFTFDGFSFTEEYRTMDGTENYYNVNGNLTHVFYGCSLDGFRMYTLYDGASMVLSAESDVTIAGGREICTNDESIIGACGNEGLFIYTYVPGGSHYHHSTSSFSVNFSYSTSSYIVDTSFWHSGGLMDGSAWTKIVFYNSSHGSFDDPIIRFFDDVSGNVFGYVENGITFNDMGRSNWNTSGFVKLRFNILDCSGVVDYYINSTKFTGVACDVSQIASNYRIDRMEVLCTDYNLNNLWDDFNYTVNDSYCEGGGAGGCYEGNTIIGKLQPIASYAMKYHYVKTLYRVPLDATINSVHLFVPDYQIESGALYYVGADELDDYYLYINGDYCGIASSIIPYTSYGFSGYLIQFCNLSYDVNDEDGDILLTFIQFGSSSSDGYWWHVYHGSLLYDLDEDGAIEFKYNSTYQSQYTGNTRYNDLCYQMYCDRIIVDPGTSPFVDDLITLPKTGFVTGETVPLVWYLTTFSYNNIIHLWHNGTEITSTFYSLPYTVTLLQYQGFFYYVPTEIGNYKFTLVRNSVQLCSINFTVSYSTHHNYEMASFPNPYSYEETFYIYYRYYRPTGGIGAIVIGRNLVTDFDDADKVYYVQSNTSGYITYVNGRYFYYIDMYSSNNDDVYIRIPECSLYQQLKTGDETDKIDVDYGKTSAYLLQESNSYTCNQRIFGQHNYIGYNVIISVNGDLIGDSNELDYFNFIKSYSSEGIYDASMDVLTVNGTFTLDNVSFGITGTPPTTPEDDNGIWYGLFGDYGFVFAFGIMIIFMIMPMAIASKLGIELPMLVNAGSGALGLSFCAMTGLIPLWVIFLVCIVLVVVGILILFR